MDKAEVLASFIYRILGMGGVGTTEDNMGQCVGLTEAWLHACSKPPIWGNAKDLLNDAPRAAYTVVGNSATNYPQPGDIVVWGPSWGRGYGHSAIAVAANSEHLAVFEQNDPLGAPCVVATHDYAGVQGWLTW